MTFYLLLSVYCPYLFTERRHEYRATGRRMDDTEGVPVISTDQGKTGVRNVVRIVCKSRSVLKLLVYLLLYLLTSLCEKVVPSFFIKFP